VTQVMGTIQLSRMTITINGEELVNDCAAVFEAWERALRNGRKRPGQWGERARAKRHARRIAAADRKVAEWQRRQGYNRPLNRRQLRALGIYEPMPRGR
jgi:hypothetical protein